MPLLGILNPTRQVTPSFRNPYPEHAVKLDAYVLANGSAGIDNQQFYVAYERPGGQPTRFNTYSIFFNGSQWQEPAVVNRSGTSSLPDNGFAQFTLTGASASVPEPTSAALFVGIATVRMFRRRRREITNSVAKD